MRNTISVILLAISSLILAACGAAPTTTPAVAPATGMALEIRDAWVRPASLAAMPMEGTAESGSGHGTMEGTAESGSGHGTMDQTTEHGAMSAGTTTAGYMVIKNSGSEPDYLVAAAADIAETIELHNVLMENDVMRMRPVEKIEVPAGGEVELRPGGFHVMFIDVTRDVKEGESIPVTLTFERAGTVEVNAVVRQP
ncbi:copper chaperone PCu(A)C [Candidatus Chloroploca sp. Khr17]|uniref:copper chaperone PCu(A)C n=1 Tax=Candidatus Chloroploca sp. Khr17 TaxID=2496869 RepID=UPI00101BC6DE|nr:copper chaperone PCu(A)C [Candidatus Chloroploca sp. Khr17]